MENQDGLATLTEVLGPVDVKDFAGNIFLELTNAYINHLDYAYTRKTPPTPAQLERFGKAVWEIFSDEITYQAEQLEEERNCMACGGSGGGDTPMTCPHCKGTGKAY